MESLVAAAKFHEVFFNLVEWQKTDGAVSTFYLLSDFVTKFEESRKVSGFKVLYELEDSHILIFQKISDWLQELIDLTLCKLYVEA